MPSVTECKRWEVGEAVRAILGKHCIEGFTGRTEMKPVKPEVVATRKNFRDFQRFDQPG